MEIINILLPLIGCLTGFLIAFVFKPKDSKLILAFSGAFLISLIVFDILPVIYGIPTFTPGPWIMAGILLQIILEFLSNGSEHGHSYTKIDQNKPLLILVSLCFHSILEGFPMNKFETLSYALFLHKIPVAIVVYLIFVKNKKSYSYSFFCLGLFSVATPLGAIISYNIPFLNDLLNQLTSLVVGMLLHIGTTILFESSQDHKFNIQKILSILAAILVSIII